MVDVKTTKRVRLLRVITVKGNNPVNSKIGVWVNTDPFTVCHYNIKNLPMEAIKDGQKVVICDCYDCDSVC